MAASLPCCRSRYKRREASRRDAGGKHEAASAPAAFTLALPVPTAALTPETLEDVRRVDRAAVESCTSITKGSSRHRSLQCAVPKVRRRAGTSRV